MVCETVLPSIGIGVLLFFSEILPFVSSIQANGVTDFMIKVLLKYLEKKKKENIEEIGDIENNLHEN